MLIHDISDVPFGYPVAAGVGSFFADGKMKVRSLIFSFVFPS